MACRSIYIIAEGPQDAAVSGKILRVSNPGLKPIALRNEVNAFWDGIIPTTFPSVNADDEPEFGRVRVPDFFQSESHTIAIQTAGGITQLGTMLSDDLRNLDRMPDAIGIIIDADDDDVTGIFDKLVREIKALQPTLKFPDHPGKIFQSNPTLGLFVLPDNANRGTLEDTMLECAATCYPQLLPIAETAVKTVVESLSANRDWLPKKERNDFIKPFGPNKSRVSIMGAILKPTYAISNTYRQHHWVTNDTLKLPKLAMLNSFLAELLS